VLRNVDTLLVSIWGPHTWGLHMSWLAIDLRAAIVSLRNKCARIRRRDETGDFTVWPVAPPWAGKHNCDRPKFIACLIDFRASPTERKSMTSSVGFLSSSATYGRRATWSQGVQYQGRRDARTTTAQDRSALQQPERRTTRAVQRAFGRR